MDLYFQNYVEVLKRNFMLVIIAITLLILTFFIWAGFPFFVIRDAVADLTSNLVIIHLCISLSGGFLFSLFFVPINLMVAKNIAYIKNRKAVSAFLHIQTTWIIVWSVIFEVVWNIALQF